MYMNMNRQLLRRGKAKQLHLKTTPALSRGKELLQAGFEPTTFYVHILGDPASRALL